MLRLIKQERLFAVKLQGLRVLIVVNLSNVHYPSLSHKINRLSPRSILEAANQSVDLSNRNNEVRIVPWSLSNKVTLSSVRMSLTVNNTYNGCVLYTVSIQWIVNIVQYSKRE